MVFTPWIFSFLWRSLTYKQWMIIKTSVLRVCLLNKMFKLSSIQPKENTNTYAWDSNTASQASPVRSSTAPRIPTKAFCLIRSTKSKKEFNLGLLTNRLHDYLWSGHAFLDLYFSLLILLILYVMHVYIVNGVKFDDDVFPFSVMPARVDEGWRIVLFIQRRRFNFRRGKENLRGGSVVFSVAILVNWLFFFLKPALWQ